MSAARTTGQQMRRRFVVSQMPRAVAMNPADSTQLVMRYCVMAEMVMHAPSADCGIGPSGGVVRAACAVRGRQTIVRVQEGSREWRRELSPVSGGHEEVVGLSQRELGVA